MKNYEEFSAAMKNDVFRKELEVFLTGKNPQNREETYTAMAEFAAGRGYSVTGEELSLEDVKQREMSDDEIENVSGAKWCWRDYSCIAVYHFDQCEALSNRKYND